MSGSPEGRIENYANIHCDAQVSFRVGRHVGVTEKTIFAAHNSKLLESVPHPAKEIAELYAGDLGCYFLCENSPFGYRV